MTGLLTRGKRRVRRLFRGGFPGSANYWEQRHKQGGNSGAGSRRLADWIDANKTGWRAAETVTNPYPFDPANPDHTSFANFHIYQRIES